MFRCPATLILLVLAAATACHEAPPPPPPPARPPAPLGPSQVGAAFPDGVGDPSGWARDLLAAFSDAGLVPDATRVCGVVAVLQQESGFQADPPVANLGRSSPTALKPGVAIPFLASSSELKYSSAWR